MFEEAYGDSVISGTRIFEYKAFKEGSEVIESFLHPERLATGVTEKI